LILHCIYFSWFVGYPELATELGPYRIEPRWGVRYPTIDPTKENTYTFLDKFFGEMTKLFPDPYFHIGGDEVEGSQWARSPSIQKFILENQLNDKSGLQAYFNKRVQKMLKQYGKTMIGWEEIFEEARENLSIDKDAIIQSWKSRESLLDTIFEGYRGLLSYGYYLDHLSSSTFHYKNDPIIRQEINSSNEEQLNLILGGEACMWSEYVSETTVDSRIWPRVLAVAERLWSSSAVDNEAFLYERLFRMSRLLDKVQIGLNHRSSYKLQLRNLIPDPIKKKDLLHSFTLLADVCEPYGVLQRVEHGIYPSNFSLTTFTDALRSESERIRKLEYLPINATIFRDTFQTWSRNHLRLRQLFDAIDKNKRKQLWVQDVEQLSFNLAQTGRIGLRVLDYCTKRILHHEKNHTMNSWPLEHWILHHEILLDQLENQVTEVRLAAVRPVQRLLALIQSKM
jgi:hexosaminidase